MPHISRKIKIIFFLSFLFILQIFPQVTANCGGALDNWVSNWTVAADCTISNWLYSAWGNTIVGTNTITIASNAALITNFSANNMTFTTGKILMSGNAVVYGETTGYTWYNPDTPTGTVVTGGSYTTCAPGTQAWNPITKNFIPSGTIIEASRRGWVICR